jgi:hypothetical protein
MIGEAMIFSIFTIFHLFIAFELLERLGHRLEKSTTKHKN